MWNFKADILWDINIMHVVYLTREVGLRLGLIHHIQTILISHVRFRVFRCCYKYYYKYYNYYYYYYYNYYN
jgi:hypothetical protein